MRQNPLARKSYLYYYQFNIKKSNVLLGDLYETIHDFREYNNFWSNCLDDYLEKYVIDSYEYGITIEKELEEHCQYIYSLII